MTPLSLAAVHVATTPVDASRSLADVFARELLETQGRLERALSDYRRLVHERDAAVANAATAQASAAQRIWAVAVRCDGTRCAAVVAIDPAPEEAALAAALVALGWTCDDRGHRCWRCRR